MSAPSFISGKLSFKGKAAVASIAVSIIVIIIATAVSGGFRREIHSSLRMLGGDIQITQYSRSALPEPISIDSATLELIRSIDGVRGVNPVALSAGIVKNGSDIHGVVFKGTRTTDSASLEVVIPRRLSQILSLQRGDKMPAFFVAQTVIPRSFTVSGIYDPIVTDDDKMVVMCDIHTLQRVYGWNADQFSQYEVNMKEKSPDEADIVACEAEISALLYEQSSEDSMPLICERTLSKYPQLLDWLNLIDTNVSFILILMIIVAAVNMISGLLILLFEHMGTIGLLKALGMKDSDIARTFLLVSSRLVLKGMIIGSAVGVGLCLIQKYTHLLRLDPVNYFVSFVPVYIDPLRILLYEAAAFVVIMLVLLVPCKFISKVDPSKTVSDC